MRDMSEYCDCERYEKLIGKYLCCDISNPKDVGFIHCVRNEDIYLYTCTGKSKQISLAEFLSTKDKNGMGYYWIQDTSPTPDYWDDEEIHNANALIGIIDEDWGPAEDDEDWDPEDDEDY